MHKGAVPLREAAGGGVDVGAAHQRRLRAHSFRPLGSGNFTVSSMPSILRTDTAPSALMRAITWRTKISGADAPAVKPTRWRPSNPVSYTHLTLPTNREV